MSAPILLSEAERHQFEQQGYLLLEGALDQDAVAALGRDVDRLVEECEAGRHQELQQGEAAVKLDRLVERSVRIQELMDHPRTFGAVLSLMGPCIHLLGSELFLRRPSEGESPMLPWHTDGGPSLEQFTWHPGEPVVQLKMQLFLTDLSQPQQGNFMVVPGSHRWHLRGGETEVLPAQLLDRYGLEPREILARPGDAVLFPWALWHAVSPNHGSRVRKSVTLRYGQLWCRPYDYDAISPQLASQLTPRRRRLLGAPDDLPPEQRQGHRFYYATEAAQRQDFELPEL